jgi:hypothetical protein
MNKIVIPLDGIDTEVEQQNIDINLIDPDQDNPRISFYKDNQVIDTLTKEQGKRQTGSFQS